MILSDDRGNVLDYFDKFPENTNIGIALSGGADSTLLLFLFVSMIYERKAYYVKIYPIHGYDSSRTNQIKTDSESWQQVLKIVEWIREWFSDKPNLDEILQEPNIFSYKKNDTIKREYHKPHMDYMKKRYNIPFIVHGITLGMPSEQRPDENLQLMPRNQNQPWFPLGTVDKQFIAYQYEYFGINELSKLTNSCIADAPLPCKECFWCRERYWAFKNYDGGLQ